MKGWWKETTRHSLAARGIPTSRYYTKKYHAPRDKFAQASAQGVRNIVSFVFPEKTATRRKIEELGANRESRRARQEANVLLAQDKREALAQSQLDASPLSSDERAEQQRLITEVSRTSDSRGKQLLFRQSKYVKAKIEEERQGATERLKVIEPLQQKLSKLPSDKEQAFVDKEGNLKKTTVVGALAEIEKEKQAIKDDRARWDLIAKAANKFSRGEAANITEQEQGALDKYYDKQDKELGKKGLNFSSAVQLPENQFLQTVGGAE